MLQRRALIALTWLRLVSSSETADHGRSGGVRDGPVQVAKGIIPSDPSQIRAEECYCLIPKHGRSRAQANEIFNYKLHRVLAEHHKVGEMRCLGSKHT